MEMKLSDPAIGNRRSKRVGTYQRKIDEITSQAMTSSNGVLTDTELEDQSLQPDNGEVELKNGFSLKQEFERQERLKNWR